MPDWLVAKSRELLAESESVITNIEQAQTGRATLPNLANRRTRGRPVDNLPQMSRANARNVVGELERDAFKSASLFAEKVRQFVTPAGWPPNAEPLKNAWREVSASIFRVDCGPTRVVERNDAELDCSSSPLEEDYRVVGIVEAIPCGIGEALRDRSADLQAALNSFKVAVARVAATLIPEMSATESRDRWLYQRVQSGTSLKAIRRELANLAIQHDWESLESDSGIRAAVDRFAKRNRLPERLRRRRAR